MFGAQKCGEILMVDEVADTCDGGDPRSVERKLGSRVQPGRQKTLLLVLADVCCGFYWMFFSFLLDHTPSNFYSTLW